MAVRQIGAEPNTAEILPADVVNDEHNLPVEDSEFLAKRKEDAMALARLIYDIFEEENACMNRGEDDKIEEHTT